MSIIELQKIFDLEMYSASMGGCPNRRSKQAEAVVRLHLRLLQIKEREIIELKEKIELLKIKR